jgi:predicted RNA-binding protein
MKVTVQDVLDAGGEIFGLPVKFFDIKGVVIAYERERGVCVRNDAQIGQDEFFSASALEVYADGIRVLDIYGTLYRVTGHKPYGRLNSGRRHFLVDIEPLIPDKPAEPERKTCKTCKHCNKFNIEPPCCECTHMAADMWQPISEVCDKCGHKIEDKP